MAVQLVIYGYDGPGWFEKKPKEGEIVVPNRIARAKRSPRKQAIAVALGHWDKWSYYLLCACCIALTVAVWGLYFILWPVSTWLRMNGT